VTTWNAKTDTDWTAPQAIHVTIDSQDVDLTDTDLYDVAVQLREEATDTRVAAEFALDDTQLAASKVLLSLTRTQLAALAPQPHVLDVCVTCLTGDIGRQKSETITLNVIASVTRPDEPTS